MEGEIWDVEVCAWALRELCALAIQERVASSVWLEWGLHQQNKLKIAVLAKKAINYLHYTHL